MWADGGMFLNMTEIMEENTWNVETGGMAGEAKRNPITDLTGRAGCRNRRAGNRGDVIARPVSHGRWKAIVK